MSPRIALSAVVLPAPLGPISPRTRPSSTRRSTPSSAIVLPKALRRPRASMHAMVSTLLLRIRFCFRRLPAVRGYVQQLFRFQSEPLYGCLDPGPFVQEKFLAFALEQQAASAVLDEHAQAPPLLDQFFVDQLLIALQDREGIDAIVGGDIAHRGQGIAFLERAVQDHRHNPVAELPVNRLTVVPLEIHPVFQIVLIGSNPAVILFAANQSARGAACLRA